MLIRKVAEMNCKMCSDVHHNGMTICSTVNGILMHVHVQYVCSSTFSLMVNMLVHVKIIKHPLSVYNFMVTCFSRKLLQIFPG